MNKKLLLSFAVFATALSVNAQKRGEFRKAPVRQPNIVEFNSPEITTKFNTNEKPTSIKIDKKRGSINIVDTSLYFSSKKTYASPKSSNIQLISYPSQAGDSTELPTVYQIIPNNSNITLNGIKMSMVSLNKKAGSCNVDVKVYDQNSGATLAKATQNVLYSASSFSSYNFIFDKPLVTNSDILVSIEPNTEMDSLLLPTSGAYRNSSITCNITGDKLTIVSGGSNIGTSFWYNQEVTGSGIPANTHVVGFDGTTYTLSNSVSSPLSNTVVTGVNLTFDDVKYNAGYMYLKFPTVSGSQTVPDFTKAPKQTNDALVWLNLGTNQAPNWKYFDAHLSLYPLVSYTFESTPVAASKCLGDDKNVEINYSNQDYFGIAKNPLLSKIAFNSKYLGLNKRTGNYLSNAFSVKDSTLTDTIDFNSGNLYYYFTEKTADVNDTIVVTDYIWTYGYNVPGKLLNITTNILLSSAITSNATLSEAIKCNGGDAKVNVSAQGGYTSYTGTGDFTGVKAGSHSYTVTDANGCTSADTIIVSEPTALTAETKTTAASNNKTNDGLAVVTAAGGTAPYTYLWADNNGTNDSLTKTAGTFTVTVTDANGCTKQATATIEDKKLAIAELGLSNVAVYPNPVVNTLNVNFNSKSVATVELVNVAGQVLDTKVSNEAASFNTSNLVSGVYFVNIKVAEGVYTQKIIKD